MSFLQAYGLVKHPDTQEMWWVPEGIDQQPKAAADSLATDETALSTEEPDEPHDDELQESEEQDRTDRLWAPAKTLARQDLLQEFGTKRNKYSGGNFRFAAVPSIGSKAAQAVWRKDMDQVLRESMRRGIVDALVQASKVRVNLVKLDKVENMLKYQTPVCFLLLSGDYVPFDSLEEQSVPGTTRPAYHLPELLGEEQLQRLKSEASQFQDGRLLLLRGKPNIHITKRLWSLQGFVADYESLQREKAAG